MTVEALESSIYISIELKNKPGEVYEALEAHGCADFSAQGRFKRVCLKVKVERISIA